MTRARLPVAMGLAGVALALAACQPVPMPPQGGVTVPDPAACGADRLQALVGQDRGVLAGMTLPAPNRIIGPEMAVTADFRVDRLNVEYGRDGRILRVSCF